MNVPTNQQRGDLVPMAAGFHPLAVQQATADEHISFGSLFGVFRRRLTLFVATVALCVALAALITINMPKSYSARADLLIEDQGSVTPSQKEYDPTRPPPADAIATEQEKIKSRELAAKVLDRLGLMRDAGFRDGLAGRRGARALLGLETPPPAEEELRLDAINALTRNIDVRQIGTAFALSIIAENADPMRAARIANGFAQVYIEDQVATKQLANDRAVQILRGRVDQLRGQAQEDFGVVQRFRISNGLLSASATQLTEQELSTYNQQVATARSEAAKDASELATARAQLASGTGNVGEAQGSAVVSSLRSQRAALSIKVADMAGRYLETNPELVAARRQLADIDKQIDTEVSRTLSELQARAQSSAERLGSLRSSQSSARSTLAVNNQALVQLDDLERRAQASQALYESYLNRFKEVVAQSGAEQANARLLSAATIPERPSSPIPVLNLAIGLLLGLLLGTAAAFAVESSYGGFTTGEDIERRLGVRYLGAVPDSRTLAEKSADPLDALAQHRAGAFAASLRQVLTSLVQAPSGRNQVVAITSALPGEGKSTTSACLARAAALGGRSVVVVGCDQHRRTLGDMFGCDPARPGLREVLRAGAAIDDVLQIDAVSGAAVLPITTPFDQGDGLLQNGSFQRLVAKLRERFDLILLDCGPILPIAETREVATVADNVLLLVRWRKTRDQSVRQALRLLPLQVINDVGIALTMVNVRKQSRFGYEDAGTMYTKYRHYYGEPAPTHALPGA